VVWLIAGVTLARLVYLLWLCPYTLIEDETNYWEWSRHLSLSYYTKGPGIAWTIAAFARVLGENEFAVRSIAALASGVTAACVAGLTFDLTGKHRTAWYAAVIVFLMPVFQSLSLITTIDGPYAACWAACAWLGWRLITTRKPWVRYVLAAVLGVGVLYKYTMLMFVPGYLLAEWVYRRMTVLTPEQNAELVRGIFLRTLHTFLAAVLFLVIVLPIYKWNADQGWPTVRHLMGHLGLPGGDQYVRQGAGKGWTYKPQWTLNYVASQLGLAGPMLLLALVARIKAKRERVEKPEAWRAARYCLALSEPIFALYFVVSFLTQPQGNWALAGFITLIPLAATQIPGIAPVTKLTRFAWRATLVVGLVTGLGMLRLDFFTKLPVVGKYVPIWRVMGADVMSAHVQQLADEVEAETGARPFVMALHYGRASQFAFYMPGRPTVYCCSSLLLNGRVAPYDFWPDTNLRKLGTAVTPEADFPLKGQNAILNGASLKDWKPLFERVVEIGKLRADGKRDRPAFKAYGFKGFPPGGLRSEGAPPTLGLTLEEIKP